MGRGRQNKKSETGLKEEETELVEGETQRNRERSKKEQDTRTDQRCVLGENDQARLEVINE